MVDDTGLLPKKLILGIDQQGMHMFGLSHREHLHMVSFDDVQKIGVSAQVRDSST